MAKKVHEYLEEEAKRSTIDMEVAFPVIQRQWDAVSAFGPQIVQRATRYLRVTEQNSEVREEKYPFVLTGMSINPELISISQR